MAGSMKAGYEESVESQLKAWDAEIEHLDARADMLIACFEEKYYSLLRRLRGKEEELRQQLVELRAVPDYDASWEHLQDQLARTADDMNLALYDALHEIMQAT